MNAQAERNDLLTQTLQSEKIIGAAVWWTVPDDTKFSRQEFLNYIANIPPGQEFPVEIIPKQITPSKAFNRAVRSIESTRMLVRRISGTPTHDLTIQITEEIAEIDELKYKAETIVRFNSQTNLPDILVNRNPATSSLIDQRFQERLLHYEADDMRAMLIRVMKQAHAITLRESGGIYFVSKNQMPIVSAVKRFVKEINPKIEIYMMGVADSEEYRATAGKIAMNEIEIEISRFSEETAALIRPNKRTTSTRLAEIKRLAEKAEIYDIFISFQKDKIKQAIEHAKIVLASKLQESE